MMACLVASAAAQPAGAMGGPPTYSGTLLVQSTPAGGTVRLSGTLRAVGQTPFYAPNFPVGSYHVAVSRKGYYTRHTDLVLVAGDSLTIQAPLRPKSRLMGGVRSLIIPGWGQSFDERPGRATVYLTSEIAALGVATYLATQFNHSATRYNRIADSLAAATTAANINTYNAKLAEHQVAWQKHYDNAKTAAYVAAGIWILSAVYAYVLGPVRENLATNVSLEATPGSPFGVMGAAPSNEASTTRLALAVHF